MRGYKAFSKHLTCRGMQYEVGGTYEFDGKPIPCRQGFHFCKTISECYWHYSESENTRICIVEATGDIATDDNVKYCTNKITIIEEVTEEWVRKGNANASSTGYCNAGDKNSGNENTGDRNSGNGNTGNKNSGNDNTGNGNSGDYNSGSRNSGNWNSGNWNTGNHNAGDCNVGRMNTGSINTGNENTGNMNTGDGNSGNRNTGNYNTGDRNTGNCNAGNSNIGSWNTGSFNIGIFNTETPTITLFDKPSNWTYDTWVNSVAKMLLDRIKCNAVEWVGELEMTDTEKEEHPEYKTTGGYLKVLDKKDNAQIWWNNLTGKEREVIYSLPNFDKEKFCEILGITIL